MKQICRASGVAAVAVALAIGAGCEWNGPDSESVNTSQGAGININFSGTYDGILSGGLAVQYSGLGSITRLIIAQNGNELDVTDNLGNHYRGRVGSPGTVSNPDPTTGAFPDGTTVAESQMSWEGNGVEFVGIVHVVTVDDVRGETTDTSQTTTDNNTTTTTDTKTVGNNTVQTTTVTIGVPTDTFYQQTVTTVTYDTQTGRELDRTVTKTGSSTHTTSTTFTLTEANSQWRLEGTWVEAGGTSSPVDALSPGGTGYVTTTATTGGTGTGTGTN